jgi:hypothetical protein
VNTVKAKAMRKGQVVKIYGVPVRVTKREKWNSNDVKIHFEDAGFGVPPEEYARHALREVFLQLETELDLHESLSQKTAVK